MTTETRAKTDKIESYKTEVSDLYTIFGIDTSFPIFTSDLSSLSMVVGAHLTSSVIEKSYKENIKLRLQIGFGCTFLDDFIDTDLPKLCKYIRNNRAIKIVNRVDLPWLGVLSVEANQEKFSAVWLITVVDQFIYQNGYALDIKDPNFSSDVNKDKDIIFENKEVIIKTTTGEVKFDSQFNAYCWLVARATNYIQNKEDLQ